MVCGLVSYFSCPVLLPPLPRPFSRPSLSPFSPFTEPVITFAVEPHGDKLAVLYGISPRIKLNLYGIKIIKGATPDLLQTVNTRLMNHLSWSPRGQCLVLAAIKRFVIGVGWAGCSLLYSRFKYEYHYPNMNIIILHPLSPSLPSPSIPFLHAHPPSSSPTLPFLLSSAPRPPRGTWSFTTLESPAVPPVTS